MNISGSQIQKRKDHDAASNPSTVPTFSRSQGSELWTLRVDGIEDVPSLREWLNGSSV